MLIRDVHSGDKEAISKWLGGKSPDVFYEAGRRGQVIEDSEGRPVMYALFTEVERLDILFDPNETTPIRTAKALIKLNEATDNEVVTESVAHELIAFIKQIGFEPKPHTFVRGVK